MPKVCMLVKNALIYDRCVMEVGPGFLKVRNPRSVELRQDEDGRLVGVWQKRAPGEVPMAVDRVACSPCTASSPTTCAA